MSKAIDPIYCIATPQDQAAVDCLLSASYPTLLATAYTPDVLAAALPLITRARPELLACGTYWVARIGAKVVGAGGWTLGDPSGAASAQMTGHIRHVATDPDHVRRGIARGLMQVIMANARAAGITQLSCLSTLAAVPFYRAAGFTAHGAEDVTLPGGVVFPSVRMFASL